MNSIIRWSWIIVIAIAGFAFLYSSFAPPAAVNDAEEYLNSSKNLKETGSYYSGDLDKPLDVRLFSKRPPGYSLFLALNGANKTLWIIRFVQAAFTLLLFLIGLQIITVLEQSSKITTVIYILLFCTTIPLFMGAQMVLADLLLALVVALILLFLLQYKKTGTSNYISRIALLWALGIAIKPVLLPSIFLALFLFLYWGIKKKRWKPIILLPILLFVLISSVNFRSTGVFHYSSIGTINMAFYNAKLLVANMDGQEKAEAFTDEPGFAIPRDKTAFKDYVRHLSKKSKELIFSHFPSYFKVHTFGMIKMMLDPGRFEIYTFLGVSTADKSLTEMIMAGNFDDVFKALKQKPLAAGLFLLSLFMTMLKLVGLLASLKYFKKGWYLILLATLGYFVAITGPIGAFRFMTPVQLVYMVLASLGLAVFLNLFKKSSVG